MKIIAAFVVATSLSTGFAFAAGTETMTPAPAAKPMAQPAAKPKMPAMAMCKKGMVMKMKGNKHSCVKKGADASPDTKLYEEGYKLAKAGDYEKAITVLSSIEDQNNPDVLNMLGYSNRKAGRIELGISFYSKALALKPDFARAREYLGEGYVAAGKPELAKVQLAEIQKICGTTCAEYKDLAKVLSEASL